jgi:prepilin-type N-terminal cleavage/methylation domain-containing protein
MVGGCRDQRASATARPPMPQRRSPRRSVLPPAAPGSDHGFTLIELLVVITIIVVLLALLTPALDKAIYQAELAVCAANMHGVGNSLLIYTADHKRRYPDNRLDFYTPFHLYNRGGSPDLRATLKPYLSVNKSFNDPLNPVVDFENSVAGAEVFGDYNMWFGYKYTDEAGMKKAGDRWTYRGDRFNLLLSDQDRVGSDNAGQLNNSSHPDHDRVMAPIVAQDERVGGTPLTLSWWDVHGPRRRGPVDHNYLRDDLSVQRIDNVSHDAGDPANPQAYMARVPQNGDDRNPTLRIQIPK